MRTVLYPGLESHPDHGIAARQFERGLYPGILSFEMEDGIGGMTSAQAGVGVVDRLRLAHIAVSLGDPSSLVEIPATMTHRTVAPEERARMGISDGLVRFSAGLEDADDLIADLEQAFDALAEGARPRGVRAGVKLDAAPCRGRASTRGMHLSEREASCKPIPAWFSSRPAVQRPSCSPPRI